MLARAMMASGLALLMVVLTGCQTRRQGVDMSGFLTAVSGRAMQGETATVALAVKPSADAPASPPPKKIMLVRVGAMASEMDEGFDRRVRSYKPHELATPEQPWVLDEGATRAQGRLAASRLEGCEVVLGSSVFQVPQRIRAQDIVGHARSTGADWLCVFSPQTEYRRLGNDPTILFQILTLGLMPTTSKAESEVEMITIDLRTSQVIDTWRTKETGWQPAIGWTQEAASQQSADRAETRAIRAVLDRLDDRALEAGASKPRPRVNAREAWESQ